jgi:hypothetical protein
VPGDKDLPGWRLVDSGFANLWFGRVPGSENGDGQVVTCSLWIEEAPRTVRCDSFATLNLPI